MTERVLTRIGVRPLKGCFIDIFDTGDATIKVGGKPFFLLNDNYLESHHNPQGGTHPGIRPRWAELLAVSNAAFDDGLRVGDHVLCEAMKWTRKWWTRPDNGKSMSWIDLDDIIAVDDDKTVAELYPA